METKSRDAGADLCRVVCFNRRKIDALRRDLPESGGIRGLSATYKVLGHPGRLSVLALLAAEECCVCDVANILRMPLSTASQHLRALRHAGLIRPRQDGKLVFYSLAHEDVRRLIPGPDAAALSGGTR
jgi:DNA-binding transcriptional ArsR family regulator